MDFLEGGAERGARRGLEFGDDAVEHALQVRDGVSDAGEAQAGGVHVVEKTDLGDADHVLTMETVLQRLHDPAFVLQGLGVVDLKIKLEQGDLHRGGGSGGVGGRDWIMGSGPGFRIRACA